MTAREEFDLGIDQIKSAFNRVNSDRSNTYMMLESEQVDNEILRDKVRNLSELLLYTYKLFHGIVIDNWSYSNEDLEDIERRMHNLGIEVTNEQ